MLTDQSQMETSEILGTFDLDEIRAFVNDQILEDINTSTPQMDKVDHFHPLYLDFRTIIDQIDDPEVIATVNERFEEVCDIFLDALKKKYCITISEDWRADHPNSLASLTLALYSFFVLDHQDNVEEFLYNYIIQHWKELYENFESLKSKKDASTLTNRKSYNVELTVIFSNIYDVCMYILDHATPSTFFDNISKDYVPASIISNMYENGDLGGIYDDDLPVDGRDFSDCIAEMFRENTSYKSTICFEVMNRLKRWAEQSDSE